jgi:hypothetical protein
MLKVIPKQELLQIIKRFAKDEKRGISLPVFCELCGLSISHFRDVFIDNNHPLTEIIQRRVSKGYQSFKNGEVAVMVNRDRSRFVEYRKKPKLRLARSNKIVLVNGNIKLQMGIVNRNDYSASSLDEQFRG